MYGLLNCPNCQTINHLIASHIRSNTLCLVDIEFCFHTPDDYVFVFIDYQ